MAEDVEPHVEEERDPAARLIWRMRASAAIQAFGPDLQALAQAASVHGDGELQEMTQETYRVITERAEADIAAVRDPEAAAPCSEELAAMGLQGAFERMLMRVAWDDGTTCATRCARTSCCTWRSRRCWTAGSTSAAGWPRSSRCWTR